MAGVEDQSRFPAALEAAKERPRIPLLDVKIPLLGRRAMGSPLEDFVRLDLAPTDLSPDDIPWTYDVPGDPDAGKKPRGWKFTVIGVEQAALTSLGAYALEGGEWPKDVLFFDYDGQVLAGTNPEEGGHLFGGKNIDETAMFTAAIRHGTDTLRATMGRSSQGEFRIPDHGPTVIAAHLSADRVLRDYPRIRPAG